MSTPVEPPSTPASTGAGPIPATPSPVSEPTASPAGTTQASPGTGPTRDPSARFEPVPSVPPAPPGAAAVPDAKWAAILADLARRGVGVDTVVVASARAVTWRDGSLGCPEPGQFYTQALVPGWEVVVTASGTRYDYHFGHDDVARLCTRPHLTDGDSPNA